MDRFDPSVHPDPELDELFRDEPDLVGLGRRLRASRPHIEVDPHFQALLRARLMDAAAQELRPRGLARWWRPRPLVLAGAGATLGVAMIAAVVTVTVLNPARDGHSFVSASTAVDEQHAIDPGDVITVSFTQPMDHAAVERGLQIHPATTVTTQWQGNTLQITPVHRLTANTPYTVTIARTSARDVHGNTAKSDINFTFGTAPTPVPSTAPTPTPPPALAVQSLGSVDSGAAVAFAPDGSLVATSARPAGSGATGSGLLGYAADGSTTRLGPASLAVSWSPGGRSMAYLAPRTGGASVVVAGADGSHPVTLATTDSTLGTVAWSGNDQVLYVGGGQIRSVDLQQHVRVVASHVHVAAGQSVVLAPGGRYAYLGSLPASSSAPGATPSPSPTQTGGAAPAATPTLVTAPPSATATPISAAVVDLTTGAAHPLTGVTSVPSFTADGATVAWVDTSSGSQQIDVAPSAGGTATTVHLGAGSGDTVSAPALSPDAGRVAYAISRSGGSHDLQVVAVATSRVVATASGTTAAGTAWAPAGDRIGFVQAEGSGATVALAPVPGSAAPQPDPDAVPVEAQRQIDAVVAAQVDGGVAALQPLLGASLSPAGLVPGGVTRGYVVRATRSPDSGLVTADVRLVRDPTHQRPQPAFADETLTLAKAATGQPYLVTAATLGQFQVEPTGPQVIRVDTTMQGQTAVIRIAFDSDLNASTVPGAIAVTTARGRQLSPTVVYDPDSRTAIVTVGGANAGDPLHVAVGTALQDIAGQALPAPYETRTGS